MHDTPDSGSIDHETDHRLAERIATTTGEMLLELRRELDEAGTYYWDMKDEGDVAAHRFIADLLRRERPHDAVLSEEAADDRRRLTADRVWIIDPIDGTSEFAEPPRWDWAVHVALWEKGRLVAGAVAMPGIGRTFTTAPPEPLPERKNPTPVMVMSRSRNPYSAVVTANSMDCLVARLGSAGAKAMAVLMGEADIYLHDAGMSQWDVAAPAVVAETAGLHVSHLDGSPIEFNRPGLWMEGILVCRPELADQILRILADNRRR